MKKILVSIAVLMLIGSGIEVKAMKGLRKPIGVPVQTAQVQLPDEARIKLNIIEMIQSKANNNESLEYVRNLRQFVVAEQKKLKEAPQKPLPILSASTLVGEKQVEPELPIEPELSPQFGKLQSQTFVEEEEDLPPLPTPVEEEEEEEDLPPLPIPVEEEESEVKSSAQQAPIKAKAAQVEPEAEFGESLLVELEEFIAPQGQKTISEEPTRKLTAQAREEKSLLVTALRQAKSKNNLSEARAYIKDFEAKNPTIKVPVDFVGQVTKYFEKNELNKYSNLSAESKEAESAANALITQKTTDLQLINAAIDRLKSVYKSLDEFDKEIAENKKLSGDVSGLIRQVSVAQEKLLDFKLQNIEEMEKQQKVVEQEQSGTEATSENGAQAQRLQEEFDHLQSQATQALGIAQQAKVAKIGTSYKRSMISTAQRQLNLVAPLLVEFAKQLAEPRDNELVQKVSELKRRVESELGEISKP